MNTGLQGVSRNWLSGATIVLPEVSVVQKESEYSALTNPSFQSIIGATQNLRDNPE